MVLFMKILEFFCIPSVLLSDKPDIKYLLNIDYKAYLSYLNENFGKINILNKEI